MRDAAALAAATLLTPTLAAHANNLASIRLTAERYVMRADGRSTTFITAEVRDERGVVVPDGTRVTFTTTAGRLETPVQVTRNGVARVVLTAGDLPGTALVTVNLENAGVAAPAQTVITFSADADAEETGPTWVRIDGKDYVGYAVDKDIVQAVGRNGRARISYRSVSISADTLQINVKTLRVRASGNVTLEANKQKREYNNLRFDIAQLEGRAERLDDGRSVPVSIRGPQLEESPLFTAPPAEGTPPVPAPTPESIEKTAPEKVEPLGPQLPGTEEPLGPQPSQEPPAESPGPTSDPMIAPPAAFTAAGRSEPAMDGESWALEDISEASLTVVAKSIALKPGDILQFRGATFYLDGAKALSLPFHVMSLSQTSMFREQVLGLGPQGVTVDFPLYYAVQPKGVGTLHVRHGARYGSSAYSTRPGWSFDLEQTYNARRGVEGTFELTGVTRQDWGARLQHGQRFGNDTRGTVYLDFPNHRDLFATTQLTRTFNGFNLNLSGSGSYSRGIQDDITGDTYGGGRDMRGAINLETHPRALLGDEKFRYSFNVGSARQAIYSANGANAEDRSLINTHTATLRMYTAQPLRLDGDRKRTTLSQSVSLGQAWVDGRTSSSNSASAYALARDGVSLLGTTSLNHLMMRSSSVNLTYDYTQTPLVSGLAAVGTGKHRLGMLVNINDWSRTRLSLRASRSLDSPTQTLAGDLYISLGGPWKAAISSSATQYGSLRYNETQLSLIRNIAGRDVAVYYSTTSRRFQFDLTGARF